MTIYAGTALRFYTETPFSTVSGPEDPDNVYFALQVSGGDVVVVQYGEVAPPGYDQIVREGIGNYYIDINADVAGIYTYSWIGIGTVEARDEQAVVVEQPTIPFP